MINGISFDYSGATILTGGTSLAWARNYHEARAEVLITAVALKWKDNGYQVNHHNRIDK